LPFVYPFTVISKFDSFEKVKEFKYLGTAFIHSFIQSAFCLATGPPPTPKRFLHIVRS